MSVSQYGVGARSCTPIYQYPGAPSIVLYERPEIFHACVGKQVTPRFVLSREAFVTNSLQAAQAGIENLRAKIPEIAGATWFGSTTKGYAKQDGSDLDMTVFVDTDKVGLTLDKSKARRITLNEWTAYGQSRAIECEIKRSVHEELSSAGSPLPVSAHVVPISTDFLQIQASRLAQRGEIAANYYRLRAQYPDDPLERMTNWASQSLEPEDLLAIEGLQQLLRSLGQPHVDILALTDCLQQMPNSVAELDKARRAVIGENRVGSYIPIRLFNIAITPGLGNFRRDFLNAVAESDAQETTWGFFLGQLVFFENSKKHPRDTDTIPYPATISEARAIY